MFVFVPACTPQAELKLETEDQKTIYALGLILAGNLALFNFSEAKLQTLQRSRLQAQAGAEKAASQAFQDQEASEEGAERSASGLIYREVEAGSGESPTKDDTVRVHYHGTLRDGTVFDSSVNRGTPFVTKLTSVIPCWTEGVQKMRVGGKARLVCPSEIAYRDRGSPPHIKPGATIAFDVELIEIVK
jgi:FKBP-type peptidyl-prolyl cis-trans isomerase FkpA